MFYIGSAAGGLMKTTNGGITFTQLFDDQGNASIGDMVVSPSDPNILDLATGEGNPRNSASHSAQSVFFATRVLGVVLGLA